MKMLTEVLGDYAAAQTATALIATPGNSNVGIRVYKVMVSSAGTNLVHLLTGAGGAIRMEIHQVAGGTTIVDSPLTPGTSGRPDGLFDIPPGVELDVTTTLSGAHSIQIWYTEVRMTGGF
ncbi:hypothetical protein LCGC14_1564250 [marine sediment metagenome]|uniref:Uncharacterized protein n=1 Tax=marine sediment metagenome TaxID=412755 RepID=A0A0F9J7Q4_9ZZZZ